MASRLAPEELAAAVGQLAGWRLDAAAGTITREFRFDDFATAFGFMTALALHAERHDHHPDWRNVYNRVGITLSTHDAGGVTALDIDFARRADALHRRMQPA